MHPGPWLDPPEDRFVDTDFTARELVAFGVAAYPTATPPDALPQLSDGAQTLTHVTTLETAATATLAPGPTASTTTSAPSVIWDIAPLGDIGYLPWPPPPGAVDFEVETPDGAVLTDLVARAVVRRSVPPGSTGWPGALRVVPPSELSSTTPYVVRAEIALADAASWPAALTWGADSTAEAPIEHVYDGIPDRVAFAPLLDLGHADPLVSSTDWMMQDLELQVRVRHLSRFRWLFGSRGAWRLRQRQTLTGTDGWPLRQRQNGGHSGAWPLRQRQRGV